MLLHAEFLGEALEAQAIGLPLFTQQVGMRLPEHDINDAGKFEDDFGQRAQSEFNALVGGQQAKRQQDLFARNRELVLEIIRVREWHVRNAVRYKINFRVWHVIDFAQEVSAAVS